MAQLDKKILKNISKRLTKLLKNEIIKQELIATGKMLKETEAIVATANDKTGEVVFQVESTDYFSIVDGKFEIINKGLNVKNQILQDREVVRLIEDLYVGYYQNILDESIPEGAGVV